MRLETPQAFSLETVYQAGFVIGALSLVVFFLGHLGLASGVYLVPFGVLALAALAYFFIRDYSRRPRAGPDLTTTERVMLAGCVVSVLAAVPLALTPPTVRDELIQHLALPKLYLAEGRIFEIPFMNFSYFPNNADLLYMVALSAGSDVAARVIHLSFGVLTGLLLYRMLSREVSRSYAMAAFILYVTTPVVLNLSRTAYVDLAGTFYAAASLFAVLKWKEGAPVKWLYYGAVAMGLALGTKYNNLVTFFLLTLMVLHAGSGKGGALGGVKLAGVFAAVSLAVVSPWLVRNMVWTGSPLYPLVKSTARSISSGAGAQVSGAVTPVEKRFLLYGEGVLDVVLLPVRIFLEGRDNSIRAFDGVLNPLFLVFVPGAFFKRGPGVLRKNRYLLLAFFLLFLYLAFFTVDLVIRYVLPAYVAVVVLATFGVRNFMESGRLKHIGSILAAMLMMFNAVYAVGLYRTYKPWRYLAGAESRGEYLARVLPDYRALSYANENLPEGSKVMFIFSGDRGYYWDSEYVYKDRTGRWLIRQVNRASAPEDLAEAFRSMGVTHLFMKDRLFVRFVNDNFGEEKKALLAGFFNFHTVRLHTSNGFSLFEITGPGRGSYPARG